ncbi:MFS transporter [Croceimicrobium hydrocarbonivorans]|uniref:MFS transporter n=1 Tax=Croceimicrobium hydrocarbonivorans TaxID=2761580 RepID=A0A7H0VGQ7_9FLAO|nr:MFS transporter [Croceimicrobium hydrocarbonivorans]QNR24905.1 MFS transporter [Croceimicrobium hydrocarbonivorans]
MNRLKTFSQYLALILAGEAIFLLPFMAPRVFRTTLLEVYQIDNLELGYCFSLYGLVAVVSYFLGGPLADLFSARKLMSIALGLTALGGFIISWWPNYTALLIAYTFWGFSTILLFWAALMKSTRILVDPENVGKAFGWVEGGRGLSAAIWSSLAVALFAFYFQDESSQVIESRHIAYRYVLQSASFYLILVAIYVWFILPKREVQMDLNHSMKGLKKLVGLKRLWLQALILFCAYCGYKITDDVSLFGHEVWGLSEEDAVLLSSYTFYLRPITAITAGFLVDRISTAKILSFSFGISALGALALAWFPGQEMTAFGLIFLGSSLSGIYALRGIYFSLMRENQIDRRLSGTAIGILSVLGYLPDVFMSPFMGWILESNSGPIGHQNLFLSLGLIMILGIILSQAWKREYRKVARTEPASS